MESPDETIENPVTGEKIFFHQTGTEAQGEELKFEMHVEPGGFVTAEHVHPCQSEHFCVQQGELCLRQSGQEEIYHPGEEATIEPGTSHVWWNNGDCKLKVRVTFRPGDQFADFLRSLFGLAKDGKTDERGMPNILQLAVMMSEFDGVIYPSSPPRIVQKIVFGILAPIGRLWGYKARYPYPSSSKST